MINSKKYKLLYISKELIIRRNIINERKEKEEFNIKIKNLSERSERMGKHSEVLNKSYQKEMLSNIKKDLKEYYPKMKEKEIELLSKEIYMIGLLRRYDVDKYKIIRILQLLDNNYYFINEKEENRIIESAINDNTAIYLKRITDKYIKEIKNVK